MTRNRSWYAKKQETFDTNINKLARATLKGVESRVEGRVKLNQIRR